MRISIALFAMLVVSALRADVRPAALFSDRMVLQQEMPVPVWGWADPGEQVTVSIGRQKQTTIAGPDRNWMVKLDPMKAGQATGMTIAGKNTITISDVLIGEVWIGSG